MISVFYRPEQSCASNESISPSAGKPRQVVADWLARQDIADHIRIESFDPVDTGTLKLAHEGDYVDRVLACELDNGFGNKNPEVARSLAFTTGSLLAAARHAIANQTLAVSPTSGFHHAHWDSGYGFCTFNGLMVTALKLRQLGLAKRVLILDFDGHYGDGTDQIIKATKSQDWIVNVTRTKSYETARECLRSISVGSLYETCQEQLKGRPDVVLYQAGADIWKGDPLGAGLLTAAEMRQRDESVFRIAKNASVPIVFNLAGGYARDVNGTIEPVLKLHRQTIEEAINVYGRTR